MARPGLLNHPKFARLSRLVGGRALALGSLELIWAAAYESGDDRIQGPDELEALADLKGEHGFLFDALLETRFIEKDQDGWAIHDFWCHAPQYVRRRAEREAKRNLVGQTISDVRRAAVRKRWEKKREAEIQMTTNDYPINTNDYKRYTNDSTPSSQHPKEKNPPYPPGGGISTGPRFRMRDLTDEQLAEYLKGQRAILRNDPANRKAQAEKDKAVTECARREAMAKSPPRQGASTPSEVPQDGQINLAPPGASGRQF